MKLNNNFTYVKTYGLFICIDRNLLILAWLLLFRTRPFNLHSISKTNYFRLIPGKLLKVYRVYKIILKLYLLKRNDSYEFEDDFVEAPYDGHILILKTGGYKVFNLKEKKVITQYASSFKEESLREVTKKLQLISKHGISPVIKAVDYQNRSILEEYINFYKANKFYPITSYFYKKIMPIWEMIIDIYPKRRVKVEEYVTQEESLILKNIYNIEQKGYEGTGKLSAYINELLKRIRCVDSKSSIYLAISHGDLHSWNILLNRKEAVIIDLDTIRERSMFHDLFYMLYHNLYGLREKNYTEFAKHLDNIIIAAFTKLDIGEESRFNTYTLLYRLLFYLEYVDLYLDVIINNNENVIRIQKGIDHLLKDILDFQEAEIYI